MGGYAGDDDGAGGGGGRTTRKREREEAKREGQRGPDVGGKIIKAKRRVRDDTKGERDSRDSNSKSSFLV